MEHAPLRPVPTRPLGPVSDAEAVRRVAAALPAIGAREGLALALVAFVGRNRAEVAQRVGLDERELSEALARARKELRRTVAPLPGSGWCERSERLVSDRMDGSLAERDVSRLDVHLRNCPRCVEHERRLVQATDGLAAGLAAGPAAPAALTEVREAEATGPEAAEPRAAQTAATSVDPTREVGADVAPEAPAAAVPVPRPLRRVAVALSWHFLFVLAVLFAIGSFALAIAGLVGAEL